MGFLEDAVGKTKEVFDIACKKTDEILTIEKQKFTLASLKSKREKDFAALGKIYFELVKDDENADEDVLNIVDDIATKSDEIDKLEAEIRYMKYQRICTECGASVDAKSTYCNNCGAKLD